MSSYSGGPADRTVERFQVKNQTAIGLRFFEDQIQCINSHSTNKSIVPHFCTWFDCPFWAKLLYTGILVQPDLDMILHIFVAHLLLLQHPLSTS